MRAILTYHSLDASGSPISIDAEVFRQHVEWLASGQVQVTTVEKLMALPPRSDAAAITFDDGFANFASQAWPRLRERDLPATLFVVTDRVGSTNRWDGDDGSRVPTLPLLDWETLGHLAEQGVDIGSHTRTHPHLTDLEGPALEDQLAGSAARLKAELGRSPTGFSYPYGSSSRRAADAVELYYQWACTAELRPLGPTERPSLLPRLDMYYFRDIARLREWGNVRFRQRLWLRSTARRWRRRLAPRTRTRDIKGRS